MARRATIEGSLTPCAGWPAHGETETVDLTPAVHLAARSGCIKILSVHGDVEVEETTAEQTGGDSGGDSANSGEDKPPATGDELKPPGRNESTEVWAEFLGGHPHGFVTEGKDRGQLIAEWDDFLEKQ